MSKIRNPFVLTSTNYGPMIVNRWDYRQYHDGFFGGVGINLLQTSSYCDDEIAVCLKLIDRRHTEFGTGVKILDLGANIGSFTIPMAKHVTGWGDILAIEAQTPMYYALCGNITLNNCWNVRAIRAIIAEKADQAMEMPMVDLFKPANFGGLSVDPKMNADFDHITGSESTPTTSIDRIGMERLDFIKIDIEGMEIDALKGGIETIKRCKPIIFLEHAFTTKEILLDTVPGYNFVDFNGGDAIMAPK